MRILGLDYGTKRIGVALSDLTGTIASPLTTIFNNDINEVINEIGKLCDEYKVDTIVLGLPKNMNNTLGEEAKKVMDFKLQIEDKLKKQVVLIDERLTTVEAEKLLITADTSRKKRKASIDKIAASIILDSYLKRGGINGEK